MAAREAVGASALHGKAMGLGETATDTVDGLAKGRWKKGSKASTGKRRDTDADLGFL